MSNPNTLGCARISRLPPPRNGCNHANDVRDLIDIEPTNYCRALSAFSRDLRDIKHAAALKEQKLQNAEKARALFKPEEFLHIRAKYESCHSA